MIQVQQITLEGHGIRLEPLTEEHADGLTAAATDGKLWELWFTSVPEPEQTQDYIAAALAGQKDGHMLCCKIVGLRTDNFNFSSQRAIESLGAKKDGVLRHHLPRRDGTVRDSFMYSILATEWPDVKRHLEGRLARHQKA